MRGIDHPSIVKLLKFFESDEHYFLVLECKQNCLCVVGCQLTFGRSDGGR